MTHCPFRCVPSVTRYSQRVAIDIEGLYTKFGPMVLRRCRFLLRDEEAASDAMQDVFVQMLRRKESLTADAPSSLLYRSATNVCLNILRKRNREADGEAILDTIAGSDAPEARALDSHFLDRVLETQKPSTRSIAVYHYIDGMTLEETAALVNLSVSGVRKRLRSLRAAGLRLREV